MHRIQREQQGGGGGANVERIVRIRPFDRGEPKEKSQGHRRQRRRAQVDCQQKHQHHRESRGSAVKKGGSEFRIVLRRR